MSQPTLKASKECAEWLKKCLSFGWRKSELDMLEKLWWTYHDDTGKLRSPR